MCNSGFVNVCIYIYSEVNQYMILFVNIFQVAMLGKKTPNPNQQPFALTLFTSCFLRFLIRKNTNLSNFMLLTITTF